MTTKYKPSYRLNDSTPYEGVARIEKVLLRNPIQKDLADRTFCSCNNDNCSSEGTCNCESVCGCDVDTCGSQSSPE